MPIRVLRFALLFGLPVACASPATHRDEIPAEVRRRIAQAIWPENLFDSTGRPERGFMRRPFQPAFADLHIRRVTTPAVLPGVSLFVGEARPSECSHCGTRRYAVAQRDSTFQTLLDPDDIAYLAPWASPDVLGDPVTLRTFVLTALQATCLIGCDVQHVRKRSDVPDADSPFLRPADEGASTWQMPRAYSWQRNGGVLVEFALHSLGRGVFSARAESEGPDRVRVSVSPIAWYMF